MSKRPMIDLSFLTSEAAAPMQEAVQRAPRQASPVSAPAPEKTTPNVAAKPKGIPTAELQGLSFKVGPAFRKRFRQRAAAADLKLNELLFAALDAWEEKVGFKD